MSGQHLPYQLRPNKFIDRQLFIELLGRTIPRTGIEKYVYVSMGGKHLVDHKTVYRQLGIPHLFSFDFDQHTVERQNFNRPVSKAICEEMSSGSLAGRIDGILSHFRGTSNLIVWLDYTNPHERLSQLQEMIEVLGRLQPGDILRITLNASVGSLQKTTTSWKDDGCKSPQEYWLKRLKSQLGAFVPTGTKPFDAEGLPIVLAECIQLAASQAELTHDGAVFIPELITTYKDGQRMMTATVRAAHPENGSSSLSELKNWKFRSKNWNDLTRIEVPELSTKERLKIDEHMHRPPNYILDRLKFLVADTHENSLRAIQNYKLLHRYYPNFQHFDP